NKEGNLQVISGAVLTHHGAPCWAVVTADGRFGFTGNGSGSVSGFSIAPDGAIRLLGDGGAAVIGSGVNDIALSANSRYLYVLQWYLVRPDALVISKTVNESFPAAEESGSMMHGSSMMNQSPQMAHAAMDSSAMGAMDHGQMADAKAPVKLVSGRFHTNAHET